MSVPQRSLTGDLEALLAHANGRPITIGSAMEVMRSRGTAMVMLLATIPVTIPGLASALAPVVGAALAVYGVQLMISPRTPVPGFLGRRTLSYRALERIVHIAIRFGRPIEHLLQPRLTFLSQGPMRIVNGAAIAFVGVFIALPLFIPLSNELPAVFAILLLLGVIEGDGVLLLLGQISALALVVVSLYLGLLVDRYGVKGGLHVIHSAMHRNHPATTTTTATSQAD